MSVSESGVEEAPRPRRGRPPSVGLAERRREQLTDAAFTVFAEQGYEQASVADIANGMGSRLDPSRYTFLNTDLAVHIHRMPQGIWIGVRSENHYGADGVGMSRGTLFDERGPVAAIQQAQLVCSRA